QATTREPLVTIEAQAMAMNTTVKRRWLVAAFLFGLCTVLALLSSLGAYVSGAGMEQRVPWIPLLRQEFKDWYACGLLSLGVLWFCGRNQIGKHTSELQSPDHLVCRLLLEKKTKKLTA